MQTIEKLFSMPLPSTRSGVFNNTFPYPTRISPEAIAVYIACMTKPGDTVLDAFSGSGSTGIAALLCEHPTRNEGDQECHIANIAEALLIAMQFSALSAESK